MAVAQQQHNLLAVKFVMKPFKETAVGENERQQRLIERLQEDERLRGDLEDTAATALITWASNLVARATEDPARADDEVETEVQAIRRAVRTAAYSGEQDPDQVVSIANEALGKQGGAAASSIGSILAKKKEQEQQKQSSEQTTSDSKPRVVLQGDTNTPERQISQSVLGSSLNTAVPTNQAQANDTPAISISAASQDVVDGSIRRAPARNTLTADNTVIAEGSAAADADTATETSSQPVSTADEPQQNAPEPTSSESTSAVTSASDDTAETNDQEGSGFWRRNSIWAKIRRGLKGK
jgi:hypothetical protein